MAKVRDEDGGQHCPDGELLQTLMERSGTLLAIVGSDLRFTCVNPRWTEVLGWSVEEMCGKPFLDFVHPADRDATLAEVARAGGGASVGFENRYRGKDGEFRWLRWNTSPSVEGLSLCIARDVSAERIRRRERTARIRQLELIEHLLEVGHWRIDLESNTLHWSPAVFRIHGFDPATYVPEVETAIEAYHRADRQQVRKHMDEAVAKGSSFDFQLRLIRASDRAQRLVRSMGTVQVNDAGEPTEIIGVFQDITELVAAERELLRSNQALERRMAELEERGRMMASMSELADMLQSSMDIEECKEVLAVLLPRVFRGLSGVVYLRDAETGVQARASSWGALDGRWRTEEPSTCWAVRRGAPHMVHRDGVLRCRHLTDAPGSSRCVPLTAHGQLVGLLVLVAATEKEQQHLEGLETFSATVADQIALAVSNVRLRDRLRHQSLRDQLTGLYNRRFLDDWLVKQLSQATRNDSRLGLAILDLDHFKRFNDTYGHLAADRVLVGFAEVLEGSLRAEDVACRWGGEEFLIAMPGADANAVRGAVERIQEGLLALAPRDDDGVRISPPTVSVGVVSFPEHARTHDALLFRADQALYDAKHNGRNRCVIAGEFADKKRSGAA